MNESVTYKFHVSVGRSIATQAIDLVGEGYVESREEWEGMTEAQQLELLDEILADFLNNEVEAGYWEV